MKHLQLRRLRQGFTVLELLIVIVVIGVLATIIIISYNGIQGAARDKSLVSDADAVTSEIVRYATKNNGLYGGEVAWFSGGSANPNINFTPSPGNVIDIVASNTEYCVRVYNPAATKKTILTAETKESSSGACTTLHASVAAGGDGAGGTIANGGLMQSVTTANCPTVRTRVVDARDSHTYWIKKLGDGKCWMLTNLAYAGGGTNTYSDTKTLTNGTSGSITYTTASYYIVPSTTNYTTEPSAPSTATTGTGQYGYLYNWCGAMGGQATAACANATTPTPVTTTSICPAGWRLPIGNGVEFDNLNSAENGASTISDAGLLASWYAQRSGYWSNGFTDQGVGGYYASSTQASATNIHRLSFNSSVVYLTLNSPKTTGFAVRCLTN